MGDFLSDRASGRDLHMASDDWDFDPFLEWCPVCKCTPSNEDIWDKCGCDLSWTENRKTMPHYWKRGHWRELERERAELARKITLQIVEKGRGA